MANTVLSPSLAIAPLIGGLPVDRLSFSHLFGTTASIAALALVCSCCGCRNHAITAGNDGVMQQLHLSTV
jgi:hypothetical protein